MRILMVMAHPDDEVIFGWPITQWQAFRQKDEVWLLTLSHNQERHGEGAVQALGVVCTYTHVRLVDARRTENNFYRLPPRFTEYKLSDAIERHRRMIDGTIHMMRPDYIFTHNPWGEYGHGDHRFTFSLVAGFGIPLMMTDICIPNACHLDYQEIPTFWDHCFKSTGTIIPEDENLNHTLRETWYDQMKDIYERHKAWSWSGHCPVKSCYLYRFD